MRRGLLKHLPDRVGLAVLHRSGVLVVYLEIPPGVDPKRLVLELAFPLPPIQLADDSPVTPGEFLAGFAAALGLGAPGKPGLMAHIFPNKVATLLLGFSAKANNEKAKDHLGWTLKYPTFKNGIEQVLLVWRASMVV